MYAGGPTCQRGVAVIAEAKVAERVTEIDRFGDRIMVVKVKAGLVDMVIVQAFLPTTDYAVTGPLHLSPVILERQHSLFRAYPQQYSKEMPCPLQGTSHRGTRMTS